jgi:hypothetical protein
MKNAIIMYEASRRVELRIFSGQRAFLWFFTLFIYGLAVFTNREALMIKAHWMCRPRIHCTADEKCSSLFFLSSSRSALNPPIRGHTLRIRALMKNAQIKNTRRTSTEEN